MGPLNQQKNDKIQAWTTTRRLWWGDSPHSGREVLVVNRNDDQALRTLVASVSRRLQRHGDIEDTVARVKIVALALSAAFGGAAEELDDDFEARCERRVQLNWHEDKSLPLGAMLGGNL